MPRDADGIGQLIENGAQFAQDIAHVGLHLGAAGCEHGSIVAVNDLDPQTFRSHVEQQLGTKLHQYRVGLDQIFQFALEIFKTLLVAIIAIAGVVGIIGLRGRIDVGIRYDTGLTTWNNTLTTVFFGPTGNGRDQRRTKVLGHRGKFFAWNKRQQPHDQKKGHHGGHEVSVSNFPAPVGRFFFALAAASYDDPWFFAAHGRPLFLATGTRLANVFFKFHEGRAQIGIQYLATELDRKLGRVTVHAGQQGNLDAFKHLDRR